MSDIPLAGAAAGLASTLPMTIAMEAMFHELPLAERYPLPPRQITEELARKVGLDDELSDDQCAALSLASHFAYGAAMGEIYRLATGRTIPRGALSGMLFGMGVWSGSYLGLLPAFNILPPATRHPERRNALMILAHLAWGASLGALTHRLERSPS